MTPDVTEWSCSERYGPWRCFELETFQFTHTLSHAILTAWTSVPPLTA
jgi:hypothetical protein